MLITIYDPTGNPKVDLSPNDSSTQVKEVQGDSVLALSFTHYEHIELDVDDYADFLGERFWLTEKYRPRQNSKMEWVYDLKLYGVESMIKRLLVIKTTDNEDEPVFTLTAPPREHVAMIVKCMNDGMGNITDWKVGRVNGTENIVIDYFGKYCDEALREIAEKVGAEWWVEGQTVNICKCEHGEPVELGYNKGLLSIDPGTADNVKFYTRLYPVGSSRNIDREKYGFTRLQLPGGRKYVEINADKYGRVDHFEQAAFEGIYPRRVGSVSSVRSEVRTGEDGTPFTIYYFTDNSLPFDPNDYMIGGLVIRVSFQEGSELAGLGEEEDGAYFFEVNFNSDTREFEIITIWPYDNDIQLPGDRLVPKAGDKYILWNLRMPDEYYGLAEEEFLTAVNQYNADHNLDIAVYKAPTDHVWIEDNAVELTIGRRVRLESGEYFPGSGFRDSRITKITRKVNLPSSMDIEISDALSRTSQEKMADSIAEVRSYARSIGESVALPDIIRTGDRTPWTDNNLLSARRALNEFLSRKNDDTAAGLIRFMKGLEAGNFVSGYSGAGIDADGNAEVEGLTSRSFLKVYELIHNRLNAIEGRTAFADSGTIESVEAAGDGVRSVLTMRKRWEGDITPFQPGDIVYGYVNNLDDTETPTAYEAWAWVESVDRAGNSLTVAAYPGTEVPSGVNHPFEAGMVIARRGNNAGATRETYINPEYSAVVIRDRDGYRNIRQDSFYISCEDGNIVGLTGVDRPKLAPENFGTVLGRLPDGLLDPATAEMVNRYQPYLFARGIVVQDIIRIDYKGSVRREANYRGAWVRALAESSEHCYRSTATGYDTVTHDGSLWQCLYDGTTDRPGETGAWLRMTDSRGTEIWTVEPSASAVTLHEDGTATPERLTCLVARHGGDGDATFTDSYGLWKAGMRLYYSPDGNDFTDGGEPIEAESGEGIETDGGEPLSIGGNYGLYPDRGNMREFVMGTAEPIETEAGEPIETGGEGPDAVLTIGGDDIRASELGSRVVFYLVRIADGAIVAHAAVNVVRDGGRGTDGVDGLMVYPAGVFDAETEYTSEDGTSPVVEYGGNYYMLRRGWRYRGVEMPEERRTPAGDTANGTEAEPQRWQLFDRFKAVFTDVLMADFAKLGGAVFYGDWMFSQQGTLTRDDGSEETGSTDYRHFTDGSFEPNYSVNMRTGEMRAANGVFSGYLKVRFKALADSDAEEFAATGPDGAPTRGRMVVNDLNLLCTPSFTDDLVVLPSDIRYAGTRVTVCDCPRKSRNGGVTRVTAEDGEIYGTGVLKAARYVTVTGGVAEFLAVDRRFSGETGGEGCMWLLLNQTDAIRIEYEEDN